MVIISSLYGNTHYARYFLHAVIEKNNIFPTHLNKLVAILKKKN